jgi:HD-like signal output (HDOD) protein
VDDEQPILSSLRSLLHRLPYEIQLFTSGGAALEFISRRTPDIIISDMRMPNMTGLEFLERASKICPSSARLMLSGYEDKNIILDAISQGTAQQYIMKPWEDAEITNLINNTFRVRANLQKKHLDELLRKITALPSPPGAQDQLKRALRHKDRSIKELAVEVEKNPALVARILHISNSVFFAARTSITSVQEAVGFIGMEYIESLLLASEVFNHFGERHGEDFAKHLDDLWHHALQRAVIGRTIAERWDGFRDIQAEYVVCLLLDIGYIVRLHIDSLAYGRMVEIAREHRLSLDQAESKVFDVDHAEVGAALLRYWNFPEKIVTAIARHHGLTEGDAMTQIAQIAVIAQTGDVSLPHDPAINPLIDKWSVELTNNLFKESHPS